MSFDDLGDCPRTFLFKDDASGLRAILCVDDLTLGPAAGGVRTWRYASFDDALSDARSLSRAMTIKCALGGLAAGGAKTVVVADAIVDRTKAFEVLGRRVEELGGLYRCAGDLGTTDADLAALARTTRFVHTNTRDLAAAVARGTLRCVEATVEAAGRALAGLRVAVQGCGSIGHEVARALGQQGAKVFVADLSAEKAQRSAEAAGGGVLSADSVLAAEVDLLVPCATGGVITRELVEGTTAFGICGAANNVLADDEVAEIIQKRGLLYVPDVLASAGAVIDGIGDTVMGLSGPERLDLIDALKGTAAEVLARSREEQVSTEFLAREIAVERIRAARLKGDGAHHR